MNELTRQCLALPREERIKLTHILHDSLREEKEEKSRFNVLFKIATDVVGDGILTKMRDFNCVMGRRLIAYQMKLEGFPIMKIARCLRVHHSSVIHMSKMMEDVFRFAGCFKVEEAYWNEFIKKLTEHDIHARSDQGS